MASNSWVETTFTPPAGTYWLRGRMADWPANWEGTTFGTVGATIRAIVTRNGATIELGSQVASSHMLSGYVWPNAFTVDGAMPVTLRIEQTGNNSVALVDDFELVAAMTDELLADTAVEDRTKWNPLNPAASKLVSNGVQSGYLRNYDGTGIVNSVQEPFGKFWGYNRFAGDCFIFLAQNGGMQQTVTIPQSGIYRLTYHERSRVTPNNGGNPVRAWIRSEDGSYTNFISKSTRYICTNFVERSFMFNMQSAGRHVLAFQGTGYNWESNPGEDLEALIDGVSLKYVAETLADVPDVPARMRISVAEGAMLALDFPGTIHTGTVTLGGKRVVGRIDSTTHPDFICGMGAIEARPEGAVIVIR